MNEYRAYVKDQKAINQKPYAFLVVTAFTIRRDLLASATSSFDVLEIPSDVSNGDLFVLYNPKGQVIYQGIITLIEEYSIECSQIQSFYKGNWLYHQYPQEGTIEGEFAYLLGQFAHGYINGSSYQDTLIYQEKAPLLVSDVSSTNGNLPTKDDNYIVDMESFIYELYKDYGILLEFDIPYGTWNIGDVNGGKVSIVKPNYTTLKIGSNAQCITNISPITEINETNKLVVFGTNGTYRTTYVFTTTNGIVEEPIVNVGRYGVVNQQIIFSDDDINDLISANLPSEMYNHHLSFELLLDNQLYDFNDFKLGQQMDIWIGEDYYSTIFTAYEMTKEVNENPTMVKIECGKVRTSLTKKLLMGVIK